MKIFMAQRWFQFAILVAWQMCLVHLAGAETMSIIDPVAADPRIRTMIGDSAYCLRAQASKVEWSPDGKWILANLKNQPRVAQINAQTGLAERELITDSDRWALSARGDVFISTEEKLPKQRLYGWKFPSMEKLWEVFIPNQVRSVAISADGSQAAVLYTKGIAVPRANEPKLVLPRSYLQLVDTASAKVTADIPISPEQSTIGRVNMQFAQGKYLMLGFENASHAVVVVDTESKKEVTEDFLAGQDEHLEGQSPVFSPRGDAVLCVSNWVFTTFRLANKKSPEKLASDSGDGFEMLRQGEFSADGQRIAVASSAACRIYNTVTGELIEKLTVGAEQIHFSPDGKLLLLVDGSRLRLVSTETWEQTENRSLFSNSLSKLTVQRKGSLLAATDCAAVYIWDARDGHLVARFSRPDESLCIEMLQFHPNDRYLICGDGKEMWAWDLEGVAAGVNGSATSARKSVFLKWNELPNRLLAFGIDFTPDGRLAMAVRQKRAWLLDIDPDPTLRAPKIREVTLDGLGATDCLSSVKLAPGGDWVLFRAGLNLRVYKLNPDSFLTEPSPPGSGIAAFSPDGKWCAYEISKGDMNLCSLPEGKVEAVLPISQEPDTALKRPGAKAFSGDSKYLAVCAADNAAPWAGFYLWDMNTYKKLVRVETHNGRTIQVAFGEGGHTLVILNSNNTISIWNADALLHEGSK